MAAIAPAPVSGQNVEVATAVKGGGSQIGSTPRAAAPPADSSDAGSAGSGIVGGLQQAHADSVAWWYQPHGGVVDAQLANLDANGIKREFVGYGLAGLVFLLLCTSAAPLVANLICIAYPIGASLSVLRGQSNDAQRFLVYWTIFGVFSVFDYYFGRLAIYWILKVAACVVLFLPQTQGAAMAYSLAIEPLANAVARVI